MASFVPLWTWILAGVAGFLVVEAVVLWAALRWRADGDGVPSRRGLEIAWLVTPAVILLGLVAWSASVLGGDVRASGTGELPALRVHVTGMMFRWEIRHEIPGADGAVTTVETLNQLHLPVGETAEIVLTSGDVAHTFWVPQFRVKQDAVPGTTHVIRIRPMETGEFNIVCAELCGNSHYAMRGFVHVETAEKFEAWKKSRHVASARK